MASVVAVEDRRAPLPLHGDPEHGDPDHAPLRWVDYPFPRLMTFLGLVPGWQVHGDRFLRRLAYAFYVIFVVLCTLLASPYELYLYLLKPGDCDWVKAAFLTTLCIQAPLAWWFLAHYLRSAHFEEKLVPMLRIYSRQNKLRKWTRWRSINACVSVSTLLVYFIWLSIYVYPDPHFQRASTRLQWVFDALPVTFHYRLLVPMLLCELFSMIADLHIERINEYLSKHRGPKSLAEMHRMLTVNMKDRKATEEAWLYGFLVSVFMPCLCVVLFLLVCFRAGQLQSIIEQWLFFGFFVVHFAVQAVQTFMSAAKITEASSSARLEIVRRIIRKDVEFERQDFRVQAYVSYLSQCYRGFLVLGIPVSKRSIAGITLLLTGSVLPVGMIYLLHPGA